MTNNQVSLDDFKLHESLSGGDKLTVCSRL